MNVVTGIVIIREVGSSSADIAFVCELFLDYANWLGFSLCFQGFDQELAGLPGDYTAEKRGALFLAELDGEPVGCAALHACFGEAEQTPIAEMKRLYVRPQVRGKRIGRLLVEATMQRARELGYTHMRLDTIPSKMEEAVAMYRRMGFYEIKAYRPNPHADVLYMEASL